MEQKSHGSPSFINIAALLLFAVIIAVASTATTYYFLNSKTNEETPVVLSPIISPVQKNAVSTILSPTTGQLTVQTDETSTWQAVRMTDTTGMFGYEIKTPPGWSINKGFEGGHSTPNPVELTLRLEGKSCSLQTVDDILITHNVSSNPMSVITSSIDSLKENGYTSSFIKTGDGMRVEKLSDQDFIYVSIPTIKGYYDITGRIHCDKHVVEQILNQIIPTFKLIQ